MVIQVRGTKMFKSKEELAQEGNDLSLLADAIGEGKSDIWICIDLAFKSIAERIEFYKKYRDNIDLFQEEYKDIFINQYLKWVNKEDKLDATIVVDAFNDWLFEYCFVDVK